MTGLQKDVLEIILKSQLDIETAVLNRLFEARQQYDTLNIGDLIIVSNAKINEIKRQLKAFDN